jgi:uncharacterized repeat protein (TIGR03803 family)
MSIRSQVVNRVVGILAVALVLASVAYAQVSEQEIFSFNGYSGISPSSGLTADSAGRLYGAAFEGGKTNSFCQAGCGVLYVLAPKSGGGWEYRRLYAFQIGIMSQDLFPGGQLVIDAVGNIYGVTGIRESAPGEIYRMSPNSDGSWTETILHVFDINDGFPGGGLAMDAAGNLYGTNIHGGTSGLGTVYQLTPNSDGSWSYTVIHNFGPSPDGYDSMGEVAFDSAGHLYGTTQGGGRFNQGTVFELSPNASGGWKERILYSFTGGADQGRPNGPVLLDARGNLYGTTSNGDNGPGTVFELLHNSNGTWTEKTLHTFAKDGIDGNFPASGLILDRSGNLYGTTQSGGANNQGTVYKMTRLGGGAWAESVIYNFVNSFGNSNWPSGLMLRNGAMYGTTQYGGASNSGAVFQIKP